MKRIITLGICLLTFLPAFSQKLDYETDSKWFIGLNAGATWSTTDVKNKTNVGWGLTLGRALNYNYGKLFSYDLRLRYLGGNWYGQDYDTTNVTGNAFYDPAGPVRKYYDTLGYTINNFNNEAHELGLELVVHVNRWRENTGFDPYIFGGIGAAWNKTMGDLYYGDSLNALTIYDYPVGGMSKTEWNQLSDDIYDSPLDGSKNSFAVNWTPSVGIGLAYQVGPKFNIGLEHRTMFALRNTFDGYAANGSKWGMDNDLYHYTSLSLKFHLGKGRTGGVTEPVVDNNNTNGLNNGTPCKTPIVSIRRPGQANSTASERDYYFEASVSQVVGRENIHLFVNGMESTNFTFDPSTGKVESHLLLANGNNEIRLQASNACGNDEERVTITYVDCTLPVIQFVQPAGSGTSVSSPYFALVANVSNANVVTMQVNGLNSNAFNYNGGQLTANLTLNNGSNTVRLLARNECGEVEETVTILYTDCVLPSIIMLSGSGTITVTEPVFNFRAEVQNVNGKENIQFVINGVSKDFSYMPNLRTMKGSAALVPGMNTIVVNASNSCGTQSATLQIQYNPCVPPTVALLDPAGGSVTVNESNYLVRAQMTGVSQVSEIQMRVNNIVRNGGSFNAATGIYTHNVPLNDGNNSIEITVTTSCGTQKVNATIVKRACLGPQISMIVPASLVSNVNVNSLAFSAQILNIANATQTQLYLNGALQGAGTYNAGTRVYSKNINLINGANTIKLVATNECSSQELTYTVNFTPCVAPLIVMISPTAVVTTSNGTFQLQANVSNVTSIGQIELKVNGTIVTGGSFNMANGLYQHTLNLAPGNNVFTLTADNGCGSVNKRGSIVFEQPCPQPILTMVNPSSTNVAVENSPMAIQLNTQNVSAAAQIVVTVNGNVQGGGSFNAGNGSFTQNLNLSNGINNVVITATTPCGTASKSFSVRLTPCTPPSVTINSPSNMNTQAGSVNLNATILNVTNVSQIVLTVNGVVQTPGNYNPSNGLYTKTISLEQGLNTIQLTATTECGTSTKKVEVTHGEEQKITICHYPPGNTENPQQIEIPLSAWPAHQAHGDVLGPCPTSNGGGGQGDKMTICHYPPGNTENPQQIEIPVSAWPAHQAHGDVIGPCPTNNGGGGQEDKMIICHYPPGNTENPQQIEIPLSAWPAHQAHGDVIGPCPTNNGGGGQEDKMIICHYPPGNTDNPQQIEIPVSAWPAHQAHGDVVGPCPPNNGGGGGTPEKKITICHYPPGNKDNPQQIEIPESAWPAHQAHGDVLGPCPAENPENNGGDGKGNGNGDNKEQGNGNQPGEVKPIESKPRGGG
jgi:hypothetical protein